VKPHAAVLELAVALARRAGALQRERFETELEVHTKRTAIDLVTEIDRACEALIVEALALERPDDAVLGEEGSAHGAADAEWRWIIDPLDGTTNYAHGYPCFCVSIGVEHRGERAVGVVYQPLLDELFHAVRGAGAYLNGRRLHVSRENDLSRALLVTGFSYDVHTSIDDNVRQFTMAVKAARGVRRDGSAALDLCYVAAGRCDGFWEFNLRPWDIAAGILLVEEAGGCVSDIRGGPPAAGESVLASNGVLHSALLELLGAASTPSAGNNSRAGAGGSTRGSKTGPASPSFSTKSS